MNSSLEVFPPETGGDIRQRLLELRRRRHEAATTGAVTSRRLESAGTVLSFAQEGLWFLDQVTGPSGAYNVTSTLHLTGPLDVAALDRSIGSLVARHASLRTAFVQRNGMPVQLVQPEVTIHLPVIDTHDLDEQNRRLRESAMQAFDLSHSPLLRAQLLRRSATEHVLHLVVHHIVFDGWSRQVMLRELAALYEAYHQGGTSPLPPLAIQYSDYAVWQRERLQGVRLEQMLTYWRGRLAGLEPLSLPTDRPRPAQASQEAAIEEVTVSGDLRDRLHALAQRGHATLFMLLLAAFKVLLMRYCGQDDVAVGTPVAGRSRPELEGLVGCFVNTVVLRTDLSGNPSFEQVLGRVRQTALDAYEQQELPFERLVAELSPKRELDGNPLFDVLVNQFDERGERPQFSELDVREIESQRELAKFAVTLYIHPRQQEVALRLVFRRDLFTQSWGTCCLAQYVGLLEQIAGAPERSIHDYSLVSGHAPSWLPDPTAEIPAPLQVPVTQQVLACAAATPQGIAVSTGARQWSYADLMQRATALSSILCAQSVARGDVVAILGPRSFAVVGSMLAVLVCGAVFVTIDPALPRERRRLVLREAGAKLLCVVEHAGQPIDLGEDDELGVVRLDSNLDTLESPGDDAPFAFPTITGDDAAYVFFTSGSTGRPKAVLGCHKGLSQFLQWQRQTFDIGQDDRVSQLIALSFDPLLRDIFLPLTSGGVVCIPQEQDTFRALRWLQDERITVVHTTPSLLQSWLADEHTEVALPNLRWLFLSGESLTGGLIARWRQCCATNARIVNLYGPTETTMVRCYYTVPDEFERGIQPIGVPIAQTQALVLSAAGHPCGVSEPGEIVLRTPFRTLGYLNLPEENRTRFRKNPQRNDPDDLLYFTGDRGRFRPDGVLELAGRLDDQVKIRGVRVEPGEVGAVLARHDAIRSCTVAARKNATGDNELVGYVVLAPARELGVHQLSEYLKEQLPAALVPSHFVFLDAMPLLPNGKVDRAALPEPQRDTLDAGYIAPRTPIEHALAGIWSDLLGVGRVGAHDNFFDLGGHSLLAARMMARLRSELGDEIPLRWLFEAPTVAELATRIEAHEPHALDRRDARELLALKLRRELHQAALPSAAIVRRAESAAVPLSFAQEGLWFLDQLVGLSGIYNIPQALRLSGRLDVVALQSALRALVERHESLRTGFESREGAAVQVVHAVVQAAALLQLTPEQAPGHSLAEREQAIEAWLRTGAAESFDLSRAPLLRAKLLRLDDQEHVLLLVVHHIVADGWSMGILARELGALYAAFCAGQSNPLAALPIQFADYAVWQRQRLEGPSAEGDLAYWREQLKELQVLQLPTDRVRPARPNYHGARERFEIEPSVLAELKALARRENVTLYMLLLGAFQVLLMRYSGQHDVVVGSPVAGRHRTELEGLIGYFVNTLVLRSDLSGSPSFVELLARVRQVCLDAYAHQELPFDRLVAELSPQRDLSRNPLYQVMFTLQNMPASVLALGELRAQRLPLDSATAKFDLSVSLSEDGAGLAGTLEYSTQLFDAATIERMARHYRQLLRAIVARPEQSIARLPLMDEREREQLLFTWNDTAREYPLHQNLHQLFEAQVLRSPQAPAVIADAEQLSYAELNARANRLAHHLRTLGVGPDVLVGLCMQRSPAMVVALLAILKAGGAYVPLDPQYPRERLAFMLGDTAAPVVLTEQALRAQLPQTAAHVLCIDTDWHHLAQLPDTNPPALATQDHLAYVIYTSGSTGTPKGVMVPNRAVVNFLTSMAREPALAVSDRVVAVTTLSFDISQLELLLPLTVGAQIVVASDDQVLDGKALRGLLDKSGASVMQATPTTWRMLIEAGWQGSPTFKALIGGESLPQDLAEQLLERTGSLWNMYGPTETTVWSTCWRVTARENGISIGRPIANTQVHILDECQHLMPIGVPGEIHIGGDGVTLGYLHRPELTAERFISDPFRPGHKLYRTGDRGRWRHDGLLEHQGRIDSQVKVRGHRIELGEIESNLAVHERVARAVAIVREDQPGDARLVAYIVPAGGMAPASELREHLRAKLPNYMLPQHYIEVDAFPLLPNGKIDRKALPAPEVGSPNVDCTAPRSPLEQRIAQIWRDLLGAERIGVHDNFFELGGHSLLAARMVARLRGDLGDEIPLRWLFEAPTVAELAARIEAHEPHTLSSSDAPIERSATGGETHLSAAQEGLWFLDQVTGPSGIYNIPQALRLSGRLDVVALQSALRALVERHESLRTGFESREGAAVQVVHAVVQAAALLQLTPEQAPGHSLAEREQAIEAWLRTGAAESFDLSRAPLLRAKLLRLDDQEHVLLLVVHHIVADGWSMGILARELGALYAAFCAGQSNPLAALPIQFADYAVWQRQRLEGPSAEGDLAYWREQLKELQVLQLPTDRVRPARPNYHGARERFEIEPSVLAELKALARRENVTLYMLLLGAFQVLLMRYSGQHDVVVGSPVAGRHRTELEGLIGYFVNTLVLRSDLSGSPSFVELLARVRQVCLDAYAHQELPFDRLVAELSPQRDLSRNPLYQVMFTLQNMPASVLALGELRAQRLPLDSATAKFDLSVSLSEDGAGLAGTLEYSTQLFDAATIERMARHYRQLLRAIVARPEQSIARLPLMDEREREQLLFTWNDTAREYPLHQNLHQLFEAQVLRSPQAPAVIADAEQLSYAELNARANRLAHHLRTLGVGPDVLVGLCMQRSPAMVVALLAILKAGGAYVPLDPQYPRERLAFMLGDTAAPVVLTEQALRAQLPQTAAHVLCIDTDWHHLAQLPDTNPPALATQDHLAYVIYTSGSTGTPKGVAVSHRGICNHSHWLMQRVGFSADDRVLLKTSISFDASGWELFAPLAAGAALVVAMEGGRGDTAYVARVMREHRVTVAQSVPSELSVLLDEPSFAECRSLRLMVSGGEALDRTLARRFVECLPSATLSNCYGPTEASIDTTCFEVRDIVDDPGTVAIGRPIANVRCHILDAELQPAPIGVVGELYIGGAGLARGYLNRADLTAERFVGDPFNQGERLYRSGDLVRYRPDGNIEYVGRSDFQVKIRGFRVELGEIEAALGACPGVRQCAVLVREDQLDMKRLVAYVVVEGADVDVSALAALLKQRLPAHMIPSAIVSLTALPLTLNGKIDRKALPAPEVGSPNVDCTAPRSPLEQRIAQIWRDLLGAERIGVHDNFFELGGHSLLAARMVARLRGDLGDEIPLRWLFEAPTVAELAARIEAHEPHTLSSSDAPIERSATGGETHLSAAQEGLWFLDQVTGPSGIYNIPQALRLSGRLDVVALQSALRALVERHESLRTGFESREGAAVQVVHAVVQAAALLQLTPEQAPGHSLAEREQAIEAWLRTGAAESFDLSRAPLLRAKLLRLDDQEHVLLLVVHHIVADGWSMGILARELGALYAAFCAGQSNPLAALPIQFADYAVWQRQRLEGPSAEGDLAYWREQLKELQVLQLPTDRVRPARPNYHGARERFEIEPSVLAELKALARRENVTLYMLLLGAFQVLLMRYSGQHDVVVGSPVAGRHRTELEGLIGYFVNTLVLRSDLSGSPSFVELLARVRQVCLDAYAHQELPFDRLVAELSPQRDLSRNPLYQVMFTLQNMPASVLALGELRAQRLPLDSATAKFDLSVSLSEDGAGLAGTLEYSTQLFDAATIERMARHYRQLLRAIVARPEQSIARLPLMDEREREQLLFTWNDTAREYPLHQNLHQLFEAQVLRSPQAPAVIADAEQLSYAELNARANRLAHHLRTLGVGPDVLVGLCMQRSPAMVVALLAILKAGGAYVPLDPQYPRERLAFMLGDTAAPVVLTEQALRAQLPQTAAHVLCIDTDWHHLAQLPDTNPPALATQDHLAYVIYTSGSTGTPKGVAVSHRAVVQLVVNTDYVRLGPTDCVAQTSSSSFDGATFEIWGALLNGARLVIVVRDALLSGAALARQIENHCINTMFLTTALFNAHGARSPDIFRGLDHLLVGGEVIDSIAVQRLIARAAPKRLVNAYGPTETTTFATWYEVPQRAAARLPSIPIGRPIANTRCHVLDSSLEPVPVGVIGELYIGGPGLARGYLNRAELTAERFVADPFRPGERLYRTGDLVRYLADGNIDYVGRVDRQVKLRGFRMELGEIESALGCLPGVVQCAVIVREDQPGDKRLVAYVVAAADTIMPSVKELSSLLAAQLPPYMVPSAIVMLDALPITANGKLDRAALPGPILEPAGHIAPDSAPADDLERVLQSIWEATLGVRPIGRQDSFFELGGHSLLAIKLLDAVEKKLGKVLKLASLFEAPTIRAQASLLRQPESQRAPTCVVAVQPFGNRPPLFFVSGFGGALLPFQSLAKELGSNQPLYVLDVNSLGNDLGEITLEAIAAQMLDDMRKIQPRGPYHLAGFSLGGKIVYEIAQQLHRAGDLVGLLALLDCAAPGFVRLRSFPVRAILHIRHALSFERRQAAAYLAKRFWMLKKYVGLAERVEPKVFKSKDAVDRSATIVRAIEAVAQPVYSAWVSYTPVFYPGRMTLIRAEVREHRPGVIEDDPQMGWGALIGKGVDVASLRCGHGEMLDARHSRTLAALLTQRLRAQDAAPLEPSSTRGVAAV